LGVSYRPIVVRPGEGAAIGFGMVHKLAANWFGGGLAILEGTIAPGQLIPPHTHSREDECSYVLSGELTFEVGGEVGTASAGCYVVKPRDIPHAFWNAGSGRARNMETHAPGGFERHCDETRELDIGGIEGDERRNAVAEIQRRYSVTFHWERVPELITEHGLSLKARPPTRPGQ
jgi:mannose-6-phosphate isomerase-like protein (cupin superfamily)